jgi:H+/Na+-translocating ferredoxin:NAD+ oxidoreductase subunit C
MGLRSFFGILSPKLPYKDMAAEIEALPIPEKATLLWSDHSPSEVAPRVGDEIKTGQDLALNGKGPFVSTVTGRIEEIGLLTGPDGYEYVSVTVTTNPRDSFDTSLSPIDDFSKADPLELRTAINRAGFTALSSISSDPSTWPAIETLIISTLDQDSLSIANQQAFRDQIDQTEQAIQLLGRATGAFRLVLALPTHLTHIGRKLISGPVKVEVVPPVYPNGLPEMLAIKQGAGLLMKGNGKGFVGNTLVVSIEQTLAMVDCLKKGKPMMDKTITFSSGKNGSLKNFRARIGTPASDILKKTDTQLQPKGKLIMNGAMRGYACFSDDQPVTAATDSIHVQAPTEIFFYETKACANCGQCNAICPVNLEVNLLGRYSEYGIFEKCRDLGAENCIDCGLCAYVCPARRPLVQLISHAKHVIQTITIEHAGKEDILAIEEGEHPHPVIRLFETAPEEGKATKE